MKSSSQIERVHLYDSILESDSELNFGGPDYKIKYLSLQFWGQSNRNDWKNKQARLENIIKSVSKSKIKDSLTTLNFYENEVDVSVVKKMLQDQGMGNVSVTSENVAVLGG